MMSSPIAHRIRRGLAAVACLAATSCAGDLARSGKSPAYLVIDILEAASGVPASPFTPQLNSDVQTLVSRTIDGVTVRVPTIFNDSGRAQIRAEMKNPGTAAVPTVATPINDITITRYRVVFKRSDGRNEPGRDVPYGFDGGATATVAAGGETVSIIFDLVRHSNKEEPPLRNLINFGGQVQINTIAEITFYGRDQGGNEVMVTGTITVNFADFGDPS